MPADGIEVGAFFCPVQRVACRRGHVCASRSPLLSCPRQSRVGWACGALQQWERTLGRWRLRELGAVYGFGSSIRRYQPGIIALLCPSLTTPTLFTSSFACFTLPESLSPAGQRVISRRSGATAVFSRVRVKGIVLSRLCAIITDDLSLTSRLNMRSKIDAQSRGSCPARLAVGCDKQTSRETSISGHQRDLRAVA